jgi:N-acetylglucosamine-6-phosphate deacetylase
MKKVIKCLDCIQNKMVQIHLENDEIQKVEYLSEEPNGSIYVGPGLVDLQINGFGGVDFNQFPIEEKGFLKVIDSLAKSGVTSFFPTVITNSDPTIISLLSNINRLCETNELINGFVKGIHLEGPFISPKEGAKGAHDAQYIKAPDWDLFLTFQKASGNRIKIITISPEWKNASDFIKKCVEANIIVAIGHTIATPIQIQEAVDAGASLSTHLGNGAPLSLPRNSNFIFEQLASENLYASIIADGFHLPDSFLKIILKVKQEKAILVSDSTQFAGMTSGTYETHIGGKVVLDNNRLATFDNPKILAGSAVSILDCINKLLYSNLCDLKTAWSLGSIHPNNLIDSIGKKNKENSENDLVIYELESTKIKILQTFKNGKKNKHV